MFFRAEVVKIYVIFGGGEKVAKLADFRLESGGVEELDHIHVAWVRPEMFLE